MTGVSTSKRANDFLAVEAKLFIDKEWRGRPAAMDYVV
jgi:hypothetical protein